MTAPIYSIVERAPEFPCWLYSPTSDKGRGMWFKAHYRATVRIGDTHWSPDSPTPPDVIPSDPASRAAPLPADGDAAAQEATLNLIQFGVLKNADFECAKQNVKRAYAPLLERHARDAALASSKLDLARAAYTAAQADLAQLRAERDDWKTCAERTDAKMIHEQQDHNKTVDTLLAERAERDALVADREIVDLIEHQCTGCKWGDVLPWIFVRDDAQIGHPETIREVLGKLAARRAETTKGKNLT